jgi:competence protein ComEA
VAEISRRQFAVYAVAVVLVVLVGGRALRADGTSADAGAGAFTSSAGLATASGGGGAGGRGGATGAAGSVVTTEVERPIVHVAGAVRRPGVYALSVGARVQDAIRKAGGGRPGAALDALNLAAKVTDGQQILVAKRAPRGAGPAPAAVAAGATAVAPAVAGGAAATAAAPVNLNTADATQLEALDGVGPAIAAKIVEWRTQNGPFRTVDDLDQVSGIGPSKLEAMRAGATV